MAPSSQMFSQGGIRSSDWFSDRLKGGGGGTAVRRGGGGLALSSSYGSPPVYLFSALHISMVTSTDSAMVIG